MDKEKVPDSAPPAEPGVCPACGYRFSKWRVLRQFAWRFRCAGCGAALCFSKTSLQRCAEFAGLFVLTAFVVVGCENARKWPVFSTILLLALISSRVVFTWIARVEKAEQPG